MRRIGALQKYIDRNRGSGQCLLTFDVNMWGISERGLRGAIKIWILLQDEYGSESTAGPKREKTSQSGRTESRAAVVSFVASCCFPFFPSPSSVIAILTTDRQYGSLWFHRIASSGE